MPASLVQLMVYGQELALQLERSDLPHHHHQRRPSLGREAWVLPQGEQMASLAQQLAFELPRICYIWPLSQTWSYPLGHQLLWCHLALRHPYLPLILEAGHMVPVLGQKNQIFR